MADLRFDDIQGFILRTYMMHALRVFVLRVDRVQPAREWLGSLVSGSTSTPQLATATSWEGGKPPYCVNVALTYDGLAALRVPSSSLEKFPEEFVQGAVARAAEVGDTGSSAPGEWKGGLAERDVHVLLILFAENPATIEDVSTRLRAGYRDALSEVSVHDARMLPNELAHFGYRDGFAQPTIDGGLPPLLPDYLPKAPSGEFLLGHPSQYEDFSYPVPDPPEFGRNGTFVAFRILEQDCHGFEEFLESASKQTGLDKELIAAKLCGRWRNGVPLSLAPTDPNTPIALRDYNNFDYVPTATVPNAYDDRKGYRCPVGAHIRRMNPRNSEVAGNSGLKRRIIRRGLPYGPPYDPANPQDGIERGLLGLFIGVSLKDQFEFLMSDWANQGTFAPGLRGTKDPVLGDNSDPNSAFLIPVEGQKQPIKLTGISRFVKTRGAAYGFLPSATAIRYIATLPMTLGAN